MPGPGRQHGAPLRLWANTNTQEAIHVNKVKQLAKEARRWLTVQRDNEGHEKVVFRPGAPEWVEVLVREAHRQGRELMLPDDFRFEFVAEALDAIADADDLDDVSLEPDESTPKLLAWISSNLTRPSYVDEAIEETGWPGSMLAALAAGQAREKEEVLQLVQDHLEQLAEDQDEDEE